MKSLAIFFIRIYQMAVSPILGPSCRFEPSCSAYCIDAIRQKGLRKGIVLGFKRILKCHPFHHGGYDPVQ